MSYFAYLFFPKKVDLKRATSPLIRGMAYYPEVTNHVVGFPHCATGTNDLHGGFVLDSFTEEPEPREKAKDFFSNLWADRSGPEKEKLIDSDMARYEEQIELYQNEPLRWLAFFHQALGSIPRLAFLIRWEGSDKKDDRFFQERVSRHVGEITEEFFRSIKEEVLYEILR